LTAHKLRRQIDSLISTIIPSNIENAAHKASQACSGASWDLEQRYLREYPCFLNDHNMQVYDIRRKDSRGFMRLLYKIDYKRDA